MHPWTRGFFTLPILILLCAFAAAQEDAKPRKAPPRFGFDPDEITYAQKTPKEAMASITTALDRNRTDYLLAQLVDPAYVNHWIDQYSLDFSAGTEEGRRLLAFDRLVRETAQYYLNDPLIQKDLRVFAKQADWKEEDNIAVGTVDTIPARKVFLKKIGERWFLENRQQ